MEDPAPDGVITHNLPKRHDRRREIKQVIKELGLPSAKVLEAVDGRELHKQGGRCRPDKGPADAWTMSWTTNRGRERESIQFRCGSLCKANLVDVWARLGNNRSHIQDVEWAMAKKWQSVLVLEDDAKLDGRTGSQCRQTISSALAVLNRMRPDWELLMCGGNTIGGYRAKVTNNGKCGLGPDILAAECMYQSHAYVLSVRGMHRMLSIWREGWAADAGLAYLQRTTWAELSSKLSPAAKAFRLADPLFVQPNGHDSDIAFKKVSYRRLYDLRREGGRHAVPAKVRNVGGPRRRGVRKITKAALSFSAAQRGAKGGGVKAGNGRSAASAAAFRRWMLSAWHRTGTWPKLADAINKYGVSRDLYTSARKQEAV